MPIFTGGGAAATTIGPFTTGSVLFGGASGEVAEDNPKFFWDNTNDRLSIGDTESTIVINGSTIPASLTTQSATNLLDHLLFRHTAIAAQAPVILYARSRGTDGSETVVQTNDLLGTIAFLGHDGTDYEIAAQIIAEVDVAPGNNDMPGRLIFQTTPNGTVTPVEQMRIDEAGLITVANNLRIASAGSLIMRDSNDSNETTFITGNQIIDIDYTLPVSVVDAAVLSVTSAGVMSWATLINAKGGFTAGSVIFAGSTGNLSQDNAAFFWDITNDRLGLGTITPGSILELEQVSTLTGALGDGLAAMILLDPGYTGAFTVTRHNYIKCEDVLVAGSAVVTDACAMWFDAAAGTHKAVDAGTTKVSIGVVTAWIKHNVNGAVRFVPCYSSKTS